MKKLLVVGAILASLATLAMAVPASASVTYNEMIPDVGSAILPNGHAWEWSGYLHMVISSTEDGAGGWHVTVHGNLVDVKGVDLVTGDRYVCGASGTTKINARGPFPYETTTVFHESLVGQGNAPNFYAYVKVHLTVNANGVVTVSFDREYTW